MGHIGWRDPSTGEEKPFDFWLAQAEADGQALGLPFEVLHGIYKQNSGEGRPDGFSATMMLGCSRRVWLEKHTDFYTEPQSDYAAFRGVIGHSMLEANQMAEAIVERRFWRMFKGVPLSGQLDKFRITGVPNPRELAEQWADWLDHEYDLETGHTCGGPECDDKVKPDIPRSARFLIEDWKTKDKLPEYQYVAKHYQEQGNVYRWLLRLPKDRTDINFVFVSMVGVRSMPLYSGGKYANGRAKPEQIWDDEAAEDFIGKRLLLLAAQDKVDRPLPYHKVPTDELWECNWCPIRRQCYELAAEEQFEAFLKGDTVARVAPRDKAAEEKAAKEAASKRGRRIVE